MTAGISERSIALNRLVVALLVATAVGYWPLLLFLTPAGPGLLPGLLVSIHLGLLLAAALGLFRFQQRGYYCLYLLVPVSTVFLSISFIPYFPRLFPTDFRPIILTLVNMGVIGLAVTAQIAQRRALRTS